MDTVPDTFNSVEEECRFWKERAKIYQDWLYIKQEYDEFVELSRQMEKEMDVSLHQKEHRIRELSAVVTSFEDENDALKQKLISQSTELTSLRIQFEITQREQESIKQNLRSLEQKNDDLERNQRTLNESINDLGDSLDKAYEKNALLEIELEEKDAMQEKLQRLMDEIRDLKREFNVKMSNQVNSKHVKQKVKEVKSKCIRQINRKVYAPNSTSNSLEVPENGNTTISAASRKNILDIVSCMLKKLNTMQTDLETCRVVPLRKSFSIKSEENNASNSATDDMKTCG